MVFLLHSHNSSLYGLGDSIICFVKIYLWPFHSYTKSSLCVGDLVTHHTPHLRVTHIRWPVPYKGQLSSCITQWSKMDGWERMAAVQHSFKSGNIWSVNASQPPSKVKISPQVVILMCFISAFAYFSLILLYFSWVKVRLWFSHVLLINRMENLIQLFLFAKPFE